MSRSISYRPEIDGLRAFAVLPVVLFHLQPALMPGGFVGVDIFFVISGYLISQIILKESEQQVFTLRNFWGRRVKRIMPALLVVLAVTLIASLLISFPDNLYLVGVQACSVLALIANVAMWKMSGDYWGPRADDLSLLHTWSLSLEEQFYLAYPFLLILLLRVRRHRALIASAAILIGYGVCVYGTYSHRPAAFFLIPTRAWELGAGGLLALTSHARKPSKLGTTLGFLLILCAVIFIDESMIFPGYVSLLPVVGTALVLGFANGLDPRTTPVLAVLNHKAIRYIGKISYSLYLWHWPVIVLGREWQTFAGTRSQLYLLLIPLLSVLSYHFVECPARRSKKRVYTLVGGSFATLGVASVYLAFLQPLPSAPAEFNTARWMGDAYNLTPSSGARTKAQEVKMAGIDCAERTDFSAAMLSDGGIIKPYGGGDPVVVVFGNSHAEMWAPVIDDICAKLKLSVSFQTAAGTTGYVLSPPGDEYARYFSKSEKRAFDIGRMNSLRSWRPRVLLIAEPYTPEIVDKYRQFLADPVLSDVKVLFLEQPPLLDIGDVNAPRYLAWRYGRSVEGTGVVGVRNTDDGRVALRELASESANASIIPTTDLYLEGGNAIARIEKDVLYIDNDHLSLAGAELARPRIQAAILASLPPQVVDGEHLH